MSDMQLSWPSHLRVSVFNHGVSIHKADPKPHCPMKTRHGPKPSRQRKRLAVRSWKASRMLGQELCSFKQWKRGAL